MMPNPIVSNGQKNRKNSREFFFSDEEGNNNKNFSIKIPKLGNKLDFWRTRNLTLLGQSRPQSPRVSGQRRPNAHGLWDNP